jgi:predicted transcriptional regulator
MTVKQIHAVLSEERPIVYTTVLKTMQVMMERGMLQRESAGRKHIYRAAIAQEDTQDQLLDTFLQRTFGGSAKRMVMRALGNYRTTSRDIEELKALIADLEDQTNEEE